MNEIAETRARYAVAAQVNDRAGTVTLKADAPAGGVLMAGDAVLLDGPERILTFAETRAIAWNDLTVRDAGGATRPLAADERSGDLFQAVSIDTPALFFERIQLNHVRLASPFLLELGAQLAFERFDADFEVRAAALTIMAHRLLEHSIEALRREDYDQIGWIVDRAELVVSDGEKLIGQAGEKPQWQHVRWTVSLATVAGYLSLVEERIGRAVAFFAVCVRHVRLVTISKVSALNFVNGCFVHGLLCAAMKRTDDARTSLTLGIQSLPDMVAAQDLLANVWVVGDLLNVMRSARQCFIALVRFDILPVDPRRTGPVIDPATQIELGEITSPLARILRAGRIPALAQALAAARA